MKKLCITILAIVPTAFASCGALSVKFGSAMEVEIDGEVRSFANGDVAIRLMLQRLSYGPKHPPAEVYLDLPMQKPIMKGTVK